MSALQTVLMPFGKSNTGILLNIILYVVFLFIVIFFPVYFTQNKSGSKASASTVATGATGATNNIQQQISSLQDIIDRNNRLMEQNSTNTELINILLEINEATRQQIYLLRQQE
jgi:hypothetical protein